MYLYYIATALLVLSACAIYIYLNYKYVVKYKPLVILLLVLVCAMPYGTFTYKAFHKSSTTTFVELQKTREFKSNQDSEYSQLWLDFLSFRESELGRLGSEENFQNFLKSAGYTEEQYAKEVITGMLLEEGIEDTTIVDKCIEENMFEK